MPFTLAHFTKQTLVDLFNFRIIQLPYVRFDPQIILPHIFCRYRADLRYRLKAAFLNFDGLVIVYYLRGGRLSVGSCNPGYRPPSRRISPEDSAKMVDVKKVTEAGKQLLSLTYRTFGKPTNSCNHPIAALPILA